MFSWAGHRGKTSALAMGAIYKRYAWSDQQITILLTVLIFTSCSITTVKVITKSRQQNWVIGHNEKERTLHLQHRDRVKISV